MSRRWKVDDVADMEGDRVRFAHVAKHLYASRERWWQVVPDLGDPLDRCREAGCLLAELRARNPDCYRVSELCRALVLEDHDRFLAPAYRKALRDAEGHGRQGRLGDDARAWAFVGDRGVMVIVREVGQSRRPEVKTAYRVVPPRGEATNSEDFFKAAVRKLRDKTSWKVGSS